MLLEVGEKIHVMVRRRFEQDLRRHFVGEVTRVAENAVCAEGYVFVFNRVTNAFVRRTERRKRIVALTDNGNIINVIAAEVDLEKLVYDTSSGGRLIMTDHESFSLDINEFGTHY
jgi:hypothetical protein